MANEGIELIRHLIGEALVSIGEMHLRGEDDVHRVRSRNSLSQVLQILNAPEVKPETDNDKEPKDG
jgi:hypothetical protein